MVHLKTIHQFGLYFDAYVKLFRSEVDAICHLVSGSPLNLVFPTQTHLPVPITPLVLLLGFDAAVELFRKHFDAELAELVDSPLSALAVLDEVVDRIEPLSEVDLGVEFGARDLAEIAFSCVVDERAFKLEIAFSCYKGYIEDIGQMQSQSFDVGYF